MLIKHEVGLATKITYAACLLAKFGDKLNKAIRICCLKNVENGPL